MHSPTDRKSTCGADIHPSEDQLLIVSNRGPVEHCVDDGGRLHRRSTGGGVATALASVPASMPATWVASAASPLDRMLAADGRAVQLAQGRRLRLVALPSEVYELFYGTFCNPILWFLQHSLWGHLRWSNPREQAVDAWERGYLPANQAFAEAVADELGDGGYPSRVMLHDYHLYVAPRFIRDLCPRAALQQFIHIPWPGPEAWDELPPVIAQSVCEGLLANDSVVFQTQGSVHNFLLTCRALLADAQVDFSGRTVVYRHRPTRVWANPISVDVRGLRSRVSSPEARPYHAKLALETGERTIVRVDRLDPSKNVKVGFQAFDLLLKKHPEWVGRVKFLAFLVPSRTGVAEYRAHAEQVFALVEHVNRRHGKAGWTPIRVFYEHNRLQALVGMGFYHVLLVNPVSDGMNLVSKEGPVVNHTDGALVLSATAGSASELSEGALLVLPDDVEGTAEALHAALSLPEVERRERARRLRQAIVRHDLDRWFRLQLQDLLNIETSGPVLAGVH
jgi:trehalose 6-phosphate synthase